MKSTFEDQLIAEVADVAEFAVMRGITYLEAVGRHWGMGHSWIRQQIEATPSPAVFRTARREQGAV